MARFAPSGPPCRMNGPASGSNTAQLVPGRKGAPQKMNGFHAGHSPPRTDEAMKAMKCL